MLAELLPKTYCKDKIHPQMDANILLRLNGYHFLNMLSSQEALQYFCLMKEEGEEYRLENVEIMTVPEEGSHETISQCNQCGPADDAHVY